MLYPEKEAFIQNVLFFLNTGRKPKDMQNAEIVGGTLCLLEPDGKPYQPERQKEKEPVQIFPAPQLSKQLSKPGLES